MYLIGKHAEYKGKCRSSSKSVKTLPLWNCKIPKWRVCMMQLFTMSQRKPSTQITGFAGLLARDPDRDTAYVLGSGSNQKHTLTISSLMRPRTSSCGRRSNSRVSMVFHLPGVPVRVHYKEARVTYNMYHVYIYICNPYQDICRLHFHPELAFLNLLKPRKVSRSLSSTNMAYVSGGPVRT